MKRLTAILFAGLFTVGSLFAREIPKRFEDYRDCPSYCINLQVEGQMVHGHYFDIDGDKRPDVAELYPVTEYGMTENPVFYWFDLNRDKEVGEDEILYDAKMDGLNGNEEWLNRVNGTNGNKTPMPSEGVV